MTTNLMNRLENSVMKSFFNQLTGHHCMEAAITAAEKWIDALSYANTHLLSEEKNVSLFSFKSTHFSHLFSSLSSSLLTAAFISRCLFTDNLRQRDAGPSGMMHSHPNLSCCFTSLIGIRCMAYCCWSENLDMIQSSSFCPKQGINAFCSPI